MSGGQASGKHPKDKDANTLKDEISTGNKRPGRESQKAWKDTEQRTKARATSRTASEDPPKVAADPFTAALAVVPAEDWDRTWVTDRTVMLRMTSKRVKELVDKMRPPAVVRWRRSFLAAKLNGTAATSRVQTSCGVDSRVPNHKIQRGSLESWRSAQRWITSISTTITLEQVGQRVLLE
jgi:hypothetical protein